MDIQFFNTLTKQKEVFKASTKTLFRKPKVNMYHCGPTVYDYIHIGNLRSFFLADIIRRLFEFSGYKVLQVMNVTDVGMLDETDNEDKMTQALKREGKPLTLEAMRNLADFYTDAFFDDIKSLNIKIPHKIPKASEHILEDIKIIKKLEQNNLTYRTDDGIYFDTSKINDYGKLGGIEQSDDDSRSRIGINSEKKNPRDFSLWKFDANIGWESPWGRGFPGWHIECSAMSMKYLGETFDIHTGGVDLAPIHHNNEIAQSEHATGKQFVRFWLHNAFINVGDAKMAKSVGNFLTLRSIRERGYSPMDYRYLLLGARYSTPLNFTWDALDGAAQAYKRLATSLSTMPSNGKVDKELWDKALNFVADDLDTPKTLALSWDILKNPKLSPADKKATILKINELLGLMDDDNTQQEVKIPDTVKELLKDRRIARKASDWKKSDELRNQIAGLGFEVKDTPNGQEITPHITNIL